MISRRITLGLAVGIAACGLAPSASLADPSAPGVEERRQSPAAADAENEYHRGVRARVARDWRAAVDAFRRALAFRPGFADAWNELGYALRNQGRYPESLDAYHEALRLRPDFPEALEYRSAETLIEDVPPVLRVGRTSPGHRPLSTAAAHPGLVSTAGLSSSYKAL